METNKLWRHRLLVVAVMGLLLFGGSVAFADSVDTLQSTLQTYNALTFADFGMYSSDSQGPVAVGGNAFLSSFGIATATTNGQNALTVGGSVTGFSGQVYGNLYAQNPPNFTSVGVLGTTTVGGVSPVNFSSLQSAITQAASLLSQQSTTGTTNLVGGTLTMTGNLAGMNVFYVDGSLLTGVQSININIPTGATALVKVSGSSVYLGLSGLGFGYSNMQKVLYDFYQATTMTIQSTGFEGSVVAPLAAINFNNAHIDGSMIANSISGTGEYHDYFFNGSLTATPEPATLVLLGSGLVMLAGKWRNGKRRKQRAENLAL